jgi:deazaflavin-dependent oxidoreductase (nitroreductase family)
VKVGNLGNTFPKLILSSPLHPVMSKRYLLLTFIGRKSGRSYTTPVAYLKQEDTIILTTDSPWWSNLVYGAPVVVRLRGASLSGMAHPIRDRDEAVEGLAALVEAIPAYGRFAGVRRDEEGRADEADATRAIDGGRVLIRIELDPRLSSKQMYI